MQSEIFILKDGQRADPKSILSLSFTDESIESSDSLTLSHHSQLQFSLGDEIHAKINSPSQTLDLGKLQVSSIKTNHLTQITTTQANIILDWGKKLNRTFENQLPLKQLVTKLAEEHQLQTNCDASETIRYEAQVDETNLQFLHRLSKKYGYYLALKSNTLIFQKNNNNSNLLLNLDQLSSLDTTLTKKLYKSCKVTYWNTKDRKDKSVTEGSNDPILTINRPDIKTDQEARTIAQAMLKEKKRNEITGSISITHPTLFAGQSFQINGVTSLANKKLIVKQSSFTLNSGTFLCTANFFVS